MLSFQFITRPFENRGHLLIIAFQEVIIKIRHYYKTEDEFKEFHTWLKLIPCPHCRLKGFLILHGYLKGNAEHSQEEFRRGHRIFCSNRKRRNGCGRTFSILRSTILKRFSISAVTLWRYLENILHGMTKIQAFKAAGSHQGPSTTYRVFQLFQANQARIRTLLSQIHAPPLLRHTDRPTFLTITHLKTLFQNSPCPISQFQHHFQTAFLQ